MRIDVPSLAETQAAIELLRKADLRDTTVDDLKKPLTTLFKGLQTQCPTFEPGLALFRGRQCANRPAVLSELWYPPNHVAPMGRANRAGAPVLYCCSSRNPIPFELNLVPGDTVAIICLKTRTPLLVDHVGYTQTAFSRLKANREVPDFTRLEPDQYGDRNALVHDFLAEVFCQRVERAEEWRYRISVAVAEKLLPSSPFAGLMYPTMQMSGNVDNAALLPAWADRFLAPLYVEYWEITGREGMQVHFDVVDEARRIHSDGVFDWLGGPAQWTLPNPGDEVVMKEEDGHWVAYDSLGRIVEPDRLTAA